MAGYAWLVDLVQNPRTTLSVVSIGPISVRPRPYGAWAEPANFRLHDSINVHRSWKLLIACHSLVTNLIAFEVGERNP